LYKELHTIKWNSKINFLPENPTPIPEYFREMAAKMPTPEAWKELPWKTDFKVSYVHSPPEPKFMSPKHMDIVDHYQTFYLSPFRFLTFGRSVGSNYIFSDSMNTEQIIQVTQVNLVPEPKSIKDIAVHLKLLFCCNIYKPILGQAYVHKATGVAI